MTSDGKRLTVMCDHADDPRCPMPGCYHRRPHYCSYDDDAPTYCVNDLGERLFVCQCRPTREAEHAE